MSPYSNEEWTGRRVEEKPLNDRAREELALAKIAESDGETIDFFYKKIYDTTIIAQKCSKKIEYFYQLLEPIGQVTGKVKPNNNLPLRSPIIENLLKLETVVEGLSIQVDNIITSIDL